MRKYKILFIQISIIVAFIAIARAVIHCQDSPPQLAIRTTPAGISITLHGLVFNVYVLERADSFSLSTNTSWTPFFTNLSDINGVFTYSDSRTNYTSAKRRRAHGFSAAPISRRRFLPLWLSSYPLDV